MVGIFSHDFSIKHTTIKKERQDDRLDDPEMYPELYRKTNSTPKGADDGSKVLSRLVVCLIVKPFQIGKITAIEKKDTACFFLVQKFYRPGKSTLFICSLFKRTPLGEGGNT